MMRSNLKPPLPKSPIRLRSRCVLPSNSSSLQSPPGSLTKSQKPTRTWNTDLEPGLCSEYHSISCELRALSRMVGDGFGDGDKTDNFIMALGSLRANFTPLLERGRFYDEYTARRNERLRRRKEEPLDEAKGVPYSLRVSVEPTKKRGTAKKKIESLKRSVSAAYSAEKNETPRYMLRSMTKENKKLPLPLNMERRVMESRRKTVATRRARKI